MINLSRIQLELEKAKEGLREVEETIQKVEGKPFPNGPGRYGNLKVQIHSDKNRSHLGIEDGKLQRRTIASNIEPRNRRISSDDLSYTLKSRGQRDKRDVNLKRQGFDSRPQSITSRLSSISQQAIDDEDDEEFTRKLTIPSRVITTAAEAPSRQEVIAAQTGDELVKQRNRRMFGALVGTLQKFCKEETRVREREEKRLKVEKKLEEDAKREKEKLMQEKRELFLERKRREIEIKRIEWSLNRVKEYEAWEANVMPLKNFIQTHAKPHIFYLPSTHNSKTEERLAQSQKLVERMIEKRKNNLKEEIENSEKKAKRTVAEEEDEEEAENIPQNSESNQTAEPAADIDFDAVRKENGFREEDSKPQEEEVDQEMSKPDAEKDETCENPMEIDEKPTEPDSENKLKNAEEEEDEREEAEEKPSQPEEPAVNNELCGHSDERVESGVNNDEVGSEVGRTFAADEQIDKKETDDDDDDSQEVVDKPETSDVNASDAKKDDVENETKKDRDKSSPEGRRSKKRSRSPRRFGKTGRRSRSSSRRRRSYRRRSRSKSASRRSRRRTERRKSPRGSRKRSSSRSSGSASPRKRMKYRSGSGSSSKSDSD